MDREPLIDNLPDEDVLRERMVFHRNAADDLAKLIKTVVAIRGMKLPANLLDQPKAAGVSRAS